MLLIPIAAVVFAQTGSMLLAFLAFVLPPSVAILQGALGILSYRLHYCDSPKPHTPAHGLVIVNPNDKKSDDSNGSSSTENCLNIGCSCLGGRRWRRGGPYDAEEQRVLSQAAKEPPLRLLVIGDSLAIGVGTTRSCFPMLPESIARTLSKECGGRAVLWTSHGGVGASAGWVVRELQRGLRPATKSNTKKPSSAAPVSSTPELDLCSDVSSSEESSLVDHSEDTLTEGAEDSGEEQCPIEAANTSPVNWQEWRNRMARHQKRFDPDIKGPYDVVVVLTGSNDLKAACFPFLLTGDDLEFHKQAKKRGGAYGTELRRLLLSLSQRMNMRLQGGDEYTVADGSSDQQRETTDAGAKSRTRPLSVDTINNTAASQSPVPPTPSNFKRPLIVLPGNPASVIPCFNVYPLKWLTVPVVSSVDNSKREVADDNPNNVLFVEPPTAADIGPFEAQEGHLWQRRETEDTLVCLRQGSCQAIEVPMRSYYDQKQRMYGHRPLYQQTDGNDNNLADLQTSALVPKLSERPGRMGSKIFSVDGVHPNDEGFEFWGRFIGDAIVQELRRKAT